MTSEGSALTRFRRALAAGNGPAAYAAATELQRVELADALALTLLLSGDVELPPESSALMGAWGSDAELVADELADLLLREPGRSIVVARALFRRVDGSIVALLIAVVSAGIAAVSLKLNRDMVGMARREHSEFMRQLASRADFRISGRLPAWPDGVVKRPGEITYVELEIGLSNTGSKAATHAVMNVIAPAGLERFHWTKTPPSALPNNQSEATDERLPGRPDESQYLICEWPRISRKSHYVAKVTGRIGDWRDVPFRVTLQSDDLPDEVEERSESFRFPVETRA